jgi:hypothetical protein
MGVLNFARDLVNQPLEAAVALALLPEINARYRKLDIIA